MTCVLTTLRYSPIITWMPENILLTRSGFCAFVEWQNVKYLRNSVFCSICTRGSALWEKAHTSCTAMYLRTHSLTASTQFARFTHHILAKVPQQKFTSDVVESMTSSISRTLKAILTLMNQRIADWTSLIFTYKTPGCQLKVYVSRSMVSPRQ